MNQEQAQRLIALMEEVVAEIKMIRLLLIVELPSVTDTPARGSEGGGMAEPRKYYSPPIRRIGINESVSGGGLTAC